MTARTTDGPGVNKALRVPPLRLSAGLQSFFTPAVVVSYFLLPSKP
jgi:hypothetical protein